MKEKVINLKDLIFDVISHWRSIFVVATVVVALVGGMSYVNNIKSVKVARNAYVPTVEDKQAAYEKLEISTELVRYYAKNVEQYENAAHKFILTDADLSSVDTVELKYSFVMLEDELNVNALNLSKKINATLINAENLEKIGSKLPENPDVPSVAKLIKTNTIWPVKDGIVSNDNTTNYFILEVTCYGINEDYCNIIADCIVDIVDKISNDTFVKYPHECELISREHYIKADVTTIDEQHGYIERIRSYRDLIKGLKEKMSPEEVSFVESGISEEEYTKVDDTPVYVPVAKPDFKLMGIAFAGVIVLMIIFNVFVYVIVGALHISEELYDLFKLKAFDVRRDIKNPISRFIYNMRYSKVHFFDDNTTADIVATEASIKELTKVAIASEKGEALSEKVCEKIVEKLKNIDIEAVIAQDIAYNPISLKKVSECDGIVFIEKRNESKLRDIVEEINVSKENNVTIIGCVIV